MRIAVCAANYVGFNLSSFITEQESNIEFAITCKDDKYEGKIYDIFESSQIECYRELDVNSDKFLSLIRENSIDLVLLLWWPTIVKKHIIEAAKIGFINLHPSLLPYNRGKHPYYWSLVEDTPAGVSIHFITEKIDEGGILYQKEIETDITTLGCDLYSKSLEEIISLFKDNHDEMMAGNFVIKQQDEKQSTFHWGSEIDIHSEINLDEKYTALDLINVLRARTFWNGPSSYFFLNNKKYYVKIDIQEA